jgi:hypothetical protein
MTKMKIKPNKRNKQKKTYREIAMEKQANTGKIEKKKKKKKKNQGKQTMRMTTAGRKPITCWPETDVEGGIESTLRGDARKDRQQTMGGKVVAEEIGNTLKTGWEILSETPKAAPTQSAKQPTNQINKTGKKKKKKQLWGRS